MSLQHRLGHGHLAEHLAFGAHSWPCQRQSRARGGGRGQGAGRLPVREGPGEEVTHFDFANAGLRSPRSRSRRCQPASCREVGWALAGARLASLRGAGHSPQTMEAVREICVCCPSPKCLGWLRGLSLGCGRRWSLGSFINTLPVKAPTGIYGKGPSRHLGGRSCLLAWRVCPVAPPPPLPIYSSGRRSQ